MAVVSKHDIHLQAREQKHGVVTMNALNKKNMQICVSVMYFLCVLN